MARNLEPAQDERGARVPEEGNHDYFNAAAALFFQQNLLARPKTN